MITVDHGSVRTTYQPVRGAVSVGQQVAEGQPIGTLLPVTAAEAAKALGIRIYAIGAGTQLGSGCTSGHGVCGVGRGSRRSIAATVVRTRSRCIRSRRRPE